MDAESDGPVFVNILAVSVIFLFKITANIRTYFVFVESEVVIS